MLDLMGKRYVLEHCAMYLRKKQEKELLSVYVTDALKILTENTAKMVSEGVMLKFSYMEWLKQIRVPKKTAESAENIISRMKNKISALGENIDELTESGSKTDT